MLKTPKEKLFSKLYLNGTSINGTVKFDIENPPGRTSTVEEIRKIQNPSSEIHIEKITSNIDASELMKKLEEQFAESYLKSIEGALNKFIKQLADELNVSEKCAEYYAAKFFNFQIETVNEGPIDEIKMVLIPTWKSPEQLLEDHDNIKDVECEKELLYRNHGD